MKLFKTRLSILPDVFDRRHSNDIDLDKYTRFRTGGRGDLDNRPWDDFDYRSKAIGNEFRSKPKTLFTGWRASNLKLAVYARQLFSDLGFDQVYILERVSFNTTHQLGSFDRGNKRQYLASQRSPSPIGSTLAERNDPVADLYSVLFACQLMTRLVAQIWITIPSLPWDSSCG